MTIFKYLDKYDFEQLVFCRDKETGLKAIIGIHDTTLGPALGGTRIQDYKTEEEAIIDVLRLARGMTYKNAAAGLNLGGGKAVIIGDPNKIKSEELFRAFGKYIENLNGKYITAEDMNTTTEDMAYINKETNYVTGLEGKSGDPSPITAYGILKGLTAAVEYIYGDKDLKGKTVAVQGLGAVGYKLCQYLYEAGTKLFVADPRIDNVKKAVKDFGATEVEVGEIHRVECDIFSPCAIGGVINDNTIEEFNCKIIGGSANNQLEEEKHGDLLEEKGILYIPDYIINRGGVVNVYEELNGYNKDRAMKKVAEVYESVHEIIKISKKENIPTYKAADRLVEEKLKNASKKAR